MVDSLVGGIYANINKINPETLSAEGKLFLRQYRENLQLSRAIDKNAGNLLAKTISKYHNDKGEDVIPLILELTTVAFHAIEPHRKYAVHVAEYLLLGTIFAALVITEDEAEIKLIVEQTLIGIFTNPIYEFTPTERRKISGLVYQVEAYFAALSFWSRRFGKYKNLIRTALRGGLTEGLEIANAGAEELAAAQQLRQFFWSRCWGRLKFYFNLFWPLFDLNANALLRWVNKTAGITG
ncbi:hypothetical protein NO2_0374 [Candidatus Termititenax persephonae]|uniref:Uncharacterized protein n=1 Tax=Candidatus Termititenax persephonae TaxID=2218525 RepID=A0A388TFC2_9BACT|nr:hypothetical protein NO2_0374 [Candidatus Termititenax persephonae]